jgi:xanthine dehydrogenase accessory factor
MRDILPSLQTWHEQGEPMALATVVDTWGSAPRQVGSKMAVTLSGQMAGSVSAGCVEGAVIEEALAVIQSGVPRLLSYGVTDEAAFDVGLACGGAIKIFVEPFAAYQGIIELIEAWLIRASRWQWSVCSKGRLRISTISWWFLAMGVLGVTCLYPSIALKWSKPPLVVCLVQPVVWLTSVICPCLLTFIRPCHG